MLVLGLLLIGSAAATAFLLAATARLSSLVSTLLAAYLAFVANLGIVTLALSPFREVTRAGLAVAETVLLAGALAGWWVSGRPGLPLAAARAALREVVSDPVTALFLVVVVVVLAYELVLGTAPPNNGDVLTYHLARVAAWAQHGGIYWIQFAPTVRMNVFQPLAEQQVLFVVVATGKGALLSALPQELAELAILVAVYGSARRLGFQVRAAACSAFLLATFSQVALEAATARNDLVAASFPAAAACLLLGGGRLVEPALAGAAAAFGLGTKLTTLPMLPILFWLAVVRGRRTVTAWLVGGTLAFCAVGMWGYVLNDIHTAHLSPGVQAVDTTALTYPGTVANAFYLMYGMMDISVISDHLIAALALAGVLAALGAVFWVFRRAGPRRAVGEALAVSTPFLAPLFVLGAAGALAFVARRFGFPIRGPGGVLGPLNNVMNEVYTRFSNVDFSAFGPLGIVAMVAATALTLWAYARRRVDSRHLALTFAVPGFLLLESLAQWGPYLIHYFLVPVVLMAPLLASLFRGRAATAAYAAVAALTIGLTLAHEQQHPLTSPYGYGHPWDLTMQTALYQNSYGPNATALGAYDRLVPAHACVGAVLINDSEPSYLLFGPDLEHHIVFLPVFDALNWDLQHGYGLFYIVLDTGPHSVDANTLRAAGWTIRTLSTGWLGWQLASRPHYRTIGTCSA